MNNSHPPAIRQHPLVYKHFAYYAGKIVLYGVVGLYAITRRKRAPRTRAFIMWSDKVLLVRNVADYDRWTLPGGGVKRGETYAACVAREIYEELGIRHSSEDLRFIKHYGKKELGEPYGKVCFCLDLSESKISEINLSKELLEARWFSVEQPPDALSPVVRYALRDYSATQSRSLH